MSDSRVALVTGGTSGIGRETVRGLAARGWTVLVHGRDAERGHEICRAVRRETAGTATFHHADLSTLDAVGALADAIADDYDRLDALVNNAGTWQDERRLVAATGERSLQVDVSSSIESHPGVGGAPSSSSISRAHSGSGAGSPTASAIVCQRSIARPVHDAASRARSRYRSYQSSLIAPVPGAEAAATATNSARSAAVSSSATRRDTTPERRSGSGCANSFEPSVAGPSSGVASAGGSSSLSRSPAASPGA
ncbi:SDR family NAD(P)-dependent oxidoreductase [Halomicrobium sp. IBSBa]|nr:SDR family NAD(P)-dependent oxidoreductase [Halomicrobium sp. IBSBa]